MLTRIRLVSLTIALSALATAVVSSLAEEPAVYDLSPIMVTASKRPAELRAMPMSIDALSREELADGGVQSMSDVSRLAPNFKFYSVGSRRTGLFYVRGLGSSGPNTPAAGVFVDDVYYERTGFSDFDLLDVERVEVLRGPQSTLYGRNTEAGLISVVTRKPGNEFHGDLTQWVADYENYKTRLRVGGPIIENRLSYTFSIAYEEREGFTENDLTGNDVDNISHYTMHLRLRWITDNGWDIIFSGHGDQGRDGGYALATLDDVRARRFHVSHSIDGSHERDLAVYSIHARHETSFGEFQSISAVTEWENIDEYDQDFSPADLWTVVQEDELTGLSQEFRLLSGDGGALTWLAGLHLFASDAHDEDHVTYGADAGIFGAVPGMEERRPLDIETWGVAGFGHVTYALTEQLEAGLGLRYEHGEQEAEGDFSMTAGGMPIAPIVSFDARQDYDELMPEFTLVRKGSERIMTYGRIARGFRAGGFNNGTASAPATYDPETAWNYEVGIKSTWWEDRFAADVAVFYITVEDQQLIQFEPGGAGFFFRNAGEAESQGIEVDLLARPVDGLELNASFGYTDARFKDSEDPVLGLDYDGNNVPFAPSYTYNAGAQYRCPVAGAWSLFGRAEVAGIGDTSWDEANTVETDGYEIVNLRAGLEGETFDVYLFARNALDEEYEDAIYAFPGSPPIAQPGNPRVVGLEITGRF